MPSPAMQSVPAFVPAALAILKVGTWETDLLRGLTALDETAARFYGFDADAAAQGVPLNALRATIHPNDATVVRRELARVREQGGVFIVEYRIQSQQGGKRWLLTRGCYERDARTGGVTGRGIVVDLTESKVDGAIAGQACFSEPVVDQDPLDRAVDHAIQARHAIDELGDEDRGLPRRLVDGLLWTLGRMLALRATRFDG